MARLGRPAAQRNDRGTIGSRHHPYLGTEVSADEIGLEHVLSVSCGDDPPAVQQHKPVSVLSCQGQIVEGAEDGESAITS